MAAPRRIGLAFGVAASCSPAMAEASPPLPPPRPADLIPAQPPKPAPVAQPAPETAGPTCLVKLVAGGARAEAATVPAPGGGCGVETPVRLFSVGLASGDFVKLPGEPVLDCEFALVFADYVRLIVAPLGEAMLRAKVVAIETGPGYQCRSRDDVEGAKISAHAKGFAVDVAAVELAGRLRVPVERQSGADDEAFFRAMRSAACGWFTTVLGPGADSFHADNLHLDTESHGPSGSYRICE